MSLDQLHFIIYFFSILIYGCVLKALIPATFNTILGYKTNYVNQKRKHRFKGLFSTQKHVLNDGFKDFYNIHIINIK